MTTDLANESEVFLGLIGRHSYNSMDGPRVSGALRATRSLWDGVLYFSETWGITLRDLPRGDYNADTVAVLTTLDRLPGLLAVLCPLMADTVDVYGPPEAQPTVKAAQIDWSGEPGERPEIKWGGDSGRLIGQWPASACVVRLWWD